MRPFSCLFGFAFLMSLVAGSVFVVVYSDSEKERWLHAWQSLALIALLAAISGYFFIRERREAFSLFTRRLLLGSIIIAYFTCVVIVVALALSPLARGSDSLTTLIRVAAALPVPVMAWQILKQKEKT